MCILLLAAGLWGCASAPETASPGESTPPDDGLYRLRAGDVVMIEVFQEPYMTTRQRVLGDGTISVGLVGRVEVGGLTVAEAAKRVEARLAEKQFVNPQVTITVESYAPRRFVVWGQVRNPGSFVIPAEENITLPEAIAMAGGNSEIGDLRRVTVMRREGGARRKISINALGPRADSFYVREGDVIRVAETIF
ncbi:MAG: polysaccharide export protein [Terrimicrobiaceae bacterium]|nr:polysaccharide export protein [Terrimicrobiaceae bacterium]